jgi:hypothetical protein
MPYYPPRSAFAIGVPVTGGTNSTVLYTDSFGNVANSPFFGYDEASGRLTVGTITTSGSIRASDTGSAATPSLVPGSTDPDTGFFPAGANIIGFSTGGTQRATLDGSGNLIVDTGGTFRWPDGAAATPACRNSNEASGMFRRAAGELNFSRAGTEVMRVSANGWQIRQGKFSNGVAGSEVATVGAAGAAAALPAQPLGYLQILLSGGGTANIPYYNP